MGDVVVVIDTREQLPYTFDPGVVRTIHRALKTGDYSLAGLENKVAVERKTLDDFVQSLTQSRERFLAEMRRLRSFQGGCVVVEASLPEVLAGAATNGAAPAAILGTTLSLIVDYRVPVFFCGDRQSARLFVQAFLLRQHRRLAGVQQDRLPEWVPAASGTTPAWQGLARYLAGHPEMKGIGPTRAALLAREFGDGLTAALRERPAVVAGIAKVPVHVIERLAAVWERDAARHDAAAQLSAFGLTPGQASRLVARFGPGIVAELLDDPFRLSGRIPGFGFKRLDAVARRLGMARTHPARLAAGLQHTVQSHADQGDSWVSREDLLQETTRLLLLDEEGELDVLATRLKESVESGALACLQARGQSVVGLPDLVRKEMEVGVLLRRGAGPNPHREALIHHVAAVEGLSPRQREAVEAALRHVITVIAGGAGCGKTHVLAMVTGIYRRAGLGVTLAASTGKAADRLSSATGLPAQTLHRLLGMPGNTGDGSDVPVLPADLVVVDEAGMVDMDLWWRLLRSVDLRRTALVLVGDPGQLPPIGPGNAFRDIVAGGILPTSVLDEVIRQAGVLKENCLAVLRGEVRPTAPRSAGQPRPWYLCARQGGGDEVKEFLLELYEHRLHDRLGFDLLRDVQLLTPTHHGPLGTAALNTALQRLVQKKLFGVRVESVESGHLPGLLPRDKVVQTRNNYELGVMNGEVGSVMKADPATGACTIEFVDRIVEYPPGSRESRELDLAYALSMHKSQGSEFPCVIAVIHRAHSYLHHRNLFYTAVTRAQRTAIIVGDGWGIRSCARKAGPGERRTLLKPPRVPGRGGMGRLHVINRPVVFQAWPCRPNESPVSFRPECREFVAPCRQLLARGGGMEGLEVLACHGIFPQQDGVLEDWCMLGGGNHPPRSPVPFREPEQLRVGNETELGVARLRELHRLADVVAKDEFPPERIPEAAGL